MSVLGLDLCKPFNQYTIRALTIHTIGIGIMKGDRKRMIERERSMQAAALEL
jgi:hypothetical protein